MPEPDTAQPIGLKEDKSGDRYAAWIRENVDEATCRNMCRQWTHTMATFFPELKPTRGHYVCPVGGSIPHWWLVDPEGAIVDPTVAQFPTRIGEYVEFTGPDPIGKWWNCGDWVWSTEFNGACSPECYTELAAAITEATKAARHG